MRVTLPIVLLALSACRAIDAPRPALLSTPFVVSTPHPNAGPTIPDGRDLVWVALPTGSMPNADVVTIRISSSGQTISAKVNDGGIDPVAVPAELGDELLLSVTNNGSSDVASFDIRVAGSKGPVVVRTSPPPTKRDVPLNAVIVVVFSEPLAASSLTPAALSLTTAGGIPVAGQLRFADSTHLTAVFTPDTPLLPATDYTLTVTQAVTNVDGQALRNPVVVHFTTTDSSAGLAGVFTVVGTMVGAHVGHTATLLPDGRVLIAGGGTASAELFDPATGQFTLTGSMMRSRTSHSATLLPNGKVLILGGVTDSITDAAGRPSGTAELYDPATGTFSPTGVMLEVQQGNLATLLSNGKVLITGGYSGFTDCCAIAAVPELYDPSTGLFTAAGPYADGPAADGVSGLVGASATLLRDGRVLIASEPAAELYDPATNTFSRTGAMVTTGFFGVPQYIAGRSGTLLPDGRVLLVGGEHEDEALFGSAELYNPATVSFTYAGSLMYPRYSHVATALSDGRVLITGGEGHTCEDPNSPACYVASVQTAEIYDNHASGIGIAGRMNWAREMHTATLLKNGSVLIAGGLFVHNDGPAPHYWPSILTAEVFVPNSR